MTVPNYYYGQSLTLLSRVSLAENQIQDAVSFALEGQRVLEKAPLSCSAIVNNQHIAALLKKVPEDTTDIEALRFSNAQPSLNQAVRTHQNNDDLCQQLLAPVTSQIGCIELPSLMFYRKENEQLS